MERHRKPGSVPTYLIVGGIVFTPLTCGLLDVAVEVLSEEAWQRGRGSMNSPGKACTQVVYWCAPSLCDTKVWRRLARTRSCFETLHASRRWLVWVGGWGCTTKWNRCVQGIDVHFTWYACCLRSYTTADLYHLPLRIS